MTESTVEMPLAFNGHDARIIARPLATGGWHVRTEVDGRVLGWEQFRHRVQVERFRARMQGWIKLIEAKEQRLVSA
jgi:hypothetical protein